MTVIALTSSPSRTLTTLLPWALREEILHLFIGTRSTMPFIVEIKMSSPLSPQVFETPTSTAAATESPFVNLTAITPLPMRPLATRKEEIGTLFPRPCI